MSEAPRVLVLGGTGALGGAVCAEAAALGARVAFTYRSAEARAREMASRIPAAAAIPMDLVSVASVERAVDEAVEALSGLDALVQCAGVAVTTGDPGEKRHVLMGEVDESGWDRMMDVNGKGTFFAVRRAAGALRAEGGGNVVLVGSIDGVKSVPSPVHYAASKGALGAMALSMAKELGPSNVRVNLVAPGILEGGLSRALPDDLRAEYLKHCGLKRAGRLPEAAALVCFLALRNTYATGRILVLDGGL